MAGAGAFSACSFLETASGTPGSREPAVPGPFSVRSTRSTALPFLPPVNAGSSGADEEDDGGDASTCRVCLERLEPTDEVRPLGNCAHAFHRGCIDRWIDVGEATCPLCRSSLLPRQRGGLLASARARCSG